MLPRRPALCLLLLAGCGGSPTEPAGAELALPVTAPMRAREHLLHELDAHEERERERARTLEGIVPGGR